MQRAVGEVYASGSKMPRHAPKQECSTRKLNGDDLAWNPDMEANGGDLSKRVLHNRSASLFVISPHCAAVMGITLAFFSLINCSKVHVEQKIWSSSQAAWISGRVMCSRTLLRI
jgi:hypothetical protein